MRFLGTLVFFIQVLNIQSSPNFSSELKNLEEELQASTFQMIFDDFEGGDCSQKLVKYNSNKNVIFKETIDCNDYGETITYYLPNSKGELEIIYILKTNWNINSTYSLENIKYSLKEMSKNYISVTSKSPSLSIINQGKVNTTVIELIEVDKIINKYNSLNNTP
ncbi:hypothetical protein [Flammeovirga kamogawensis]|uniref:Uncharacterized protein n=1 Tax=Flammeovirga kamogawensis TaxID=373891 RepID=A0ABX8H031_9BACT|nr:hypothetical protein [Flammeovirga kamogawensis]QWG09249.1 hypothetical protein KM029_21835 [Flammeovirga kamogawensis]QWG09942.1 hypothetical protein KM029_19870 [Flammeovirga kamogawensis]TRX64774.1 hypothetical protein EO216_19745 [Flammeovirga kamogawensis]TRX65451.1 hypothetical protein EO216_23295 [Flammeovirga kamogawensis]